MSKREKKKAPMVKGEPEVEIITKVEFIYEDTKPLLGSNQTTSGDKFME